MLAKLVSAYENVVYICALEITEFNVEQAAKLLNVSRATLYRRLNQAYLGDREEQKKALTMLKMKGEYKHILDKLSENQKTLSSNSAQPFEAPIKKLNKNS